MADQSLYTCWFGNSFAIEGQVTQARHSSLPKKKWNGLLIIQHDIRVIRVLFRGSAEAEHVPRKTYNMNLNVSDQQQKNEGRVNFKCSDVGPKNCDWQVSGNSEQEIMPKIEQHGREKHNMTIDDQTRNKVRKAIHKQAA